MTKIAVFDKQAAGYDAWFEHHHELYRAELVAVLEFSPVTGQGVGIGVGTDAQIMDWTH